MELEAVTDGEFLGTTLNPRTRRLEYRQPTARHQFRPFRTAGTDAHKYSAAYARICLASRIAFPLQQAEADVQTLVRSYTTYGYNVQTFKESCFLVSPTKDVTVAAKACLSFLELMS